MYMEMRLIEYNAWVASITFRLFSYHALHTPMNISINIMTTGKSINLSFSVCLTR